MGTAKQKPERQFFVPFRAEIATGELKQFYGLFIHPEGSDSLKLIVRATKDMPERKVNGPLIGVQSYGNKRNELMANAKENLKILTENGYEWLKGDDYYISRVDLEEEIGNPNLSDPFEAFNNSKPKITISKEVAEQLKNADPGYNFAVAPGKELPAWIKVIYDGADWGGPIGTPIPKEGGKVVMTPLESIEIGNGFLPEEEPEPMPPGYWERAMKDAEEITAKMLQETAGEMMADIQKKREVDRIRQNAKICDLEIEILNMPKKKVKKDDVFKLIQRAYRIGKGEF